MPKSSATFSSSSSRQSSISNIPIQTGLSNPKDSSKPQKQIQKSVQGFEPIPKKSAIIKTDKPRPHVCTTCTRAFARYEHLKRHERSHTNEKPFQCAACGRCFARRDLVLRHQQKLHSSLSTNKESFKKGENSNIITNYGNKEVTLPTNGSSINGENAKKNPKKGRASSQMDFSSSDNSPSIQISTPNSHTSDRIEKPRSRSTIDSEHPSSLFGNTLNNFQYQQEQPQQLQHDQNQILLQPPHKRQRHNSFSASSAFSYTKEGAIISNTQSHELPEGPKQVGFATPQLSAQELTSRALQSGIDLNALGLQYDIEEFNLDGIDDKSMKNDNSNQTNSSNNKNKNLDGFQFFGEQGTNTFPSRAGTPLQIGITPSRIAMDLPIFNEYLQMGNAGGGAGFYSNNDSNNFNLFNHEKKQKKSKKVSSSANTPSDLGSLNLTLNHRSSGSDPVPINADTASTSIQNDTSSPEDWLEDFINTPFDSNFVSNPKNLNTIGFSTSSSKIGLNTLKKLSQTNLNNLTNSPSGFPLFNEYSPNLSIPRSQNPTGKESPSTHSNSSNGGIPSLFRSRQIDLFHNEVENDQNDFKLFSNDLRDEILLLNNLVDSQFPSLEELNKYVYLFKTEFDKYFPFIHLATLTPSIENYPLLLSIASVGALYGFHSTHSMLLFNISRFRIHEFLEKEKQNFKVGSNGTTISKVNSVPIWIYQSMVLLIFMGIFNNDLSITKTMAIFLNSLIELVKITALNLPLENFLTPPPIINNNDIGTEDSNSVDELIQEQNFNYFVLAQTRIRTCHTILLVSNLFTSLIGLDCSLHSIDLKCGIHCKWEELWESSNYKEWYSILDSHRYKIDSKFSLVELSNGNDSYTHCLKYLTLNNYVLNEDDQLNKKFQMKTLLSLLLSIHEKIYLERVSIKNETNGIISATKWRMNSRPVIESLIKSWESLYIKNGGVFYLNEQSINAIYAKNPVVRLILPLLSLAKIRKCVNLTSIIEKIWKKDWNGMNENLQKLRDDPEALKDATNYALDIVKLWIDLISIHQDAEKTSMKTPVFFITCIFTSLLIIAEFLLSLEKNASNVDSLSYGFLNANERTLWLRSDMIFKKIENCLMFNDNNKTYAESLRLEAKGALDVEPLDEEVATRAVSPSTDIHETAQVIQNARLSSRSLYLGVRILADAPIWPIALLFAQALKARAIHISKSQPCTPHNLP